MKRKARPILLLVDNRPRDAHGILLVYYWLKYLGCKVVLCNKGNWIPLVRIHKPSVVALSATNGSIRPVVEAVARVSRVAVIPQEGAIPVRQFVVEERYTGEWSGYGGFTKGLARIFLWGPQTAEWLLEEEVFTPDQVVVSGTPRFDPYRVFAQLSTSYAKLSGVGFATWYDKINPYNRVSMIDMVDNKRSHGPGGSGYYDDDKDVEDFFWYLIASLRTDLELLERVAAAGNSPLFVRPNAFELIDGYSFLKQKYPEIAVGNNLLVWEWLQRLACAITLTSTLGLEALLVGTPVISTAGLLGPRVRDHMNVPQFADPPFLQFYWRPETLDGAVDMVLAAQEGELQPSPQPEEYANYIKAFYDWPRSEPSSLTIARGLAELAEMPVDQAFPYQDSEGDMAPMTIKGITAPKGIVRGIADLAPRSLVDGLFAFKKGLIEQRNLEAMQRYHFYPWHRQDFIKAKLVWNQLLQHDLNTQSQDFASSSLSQHRDKVSSTEKS